MPLRRLLEAQIPAFLKAVIDPMEMNVNCQTATERFYVSIR
jgi:hypothetical protein